MRKIYLAFLWHHHQPMYRESPVSVNQELGVSIQYAMPWARMHATKDYYDTVAILDEFPQIKSTFNLVPSLLVQLDEYAKGLAVDTHLMLTLKDASELDLQDKVEILYNFFSANWSNMIDPYPRYKELLLKRGKHVSKVELSRIQNYFSEQDFRDLQVWFNLAWTDPYWRKNDNFIKQLFEKSKGFKEEEKKLLIDKHREICGKVVDKYKSMQEKGQIEISVTPFYHPILPLLCNTDIARVSMPGVVLPKKFSHPEDAKEQILKAVEYYEKIFGVKPRGMWPSEGSVSEDIIPLVADAGIKWIGTDEEILFNTIKLQQSKIVEIPKAILYQPYRVEKATKSLNIIFRDRALSDAIGFVYGSWNPAAAVEDFMSKILQIGQNFYSTQDKGVCFVPVILDGENCWEYYKNDGWDFLRELYKKISEIPEIETTTISEFLSKHPPEITLHRLFPGSWINANFGIWIGHPEDNLAWEYLTKTRNFLDIYIKNHPEKKNSIEVKNAFEELLIAEGSDWCWWYGDDHTSGQDDRFDFLFRKHLSNVYEILGEKIPDELFIAIKGKYYKKAVFCEPRDFIKPIIDGKVTNYFEWLAAGFYRTGEKGASMHQVENVIFEFYYGFDLDKLYFLININEGDGDDFKLSDFIFNVLFLKESDGVFLQGAKKASIRIHSSENIEYYLENVGYETEKKKMSEVAYKKVIEFAVPFKLLDVDFNQPIEFVITVDKIVPTGEIYELERWPYQSSIRFLRQTEEFSGQDWSV
ncbi:MAG: glycoside hydrolase family 57 protein [Elusimicrobiota bacterium]|nr:glycoside hydrolase family 57 protein [Elusimicrobiota bacterium]